jgi:nucleotide-binding universal stress UspA family protein/GNAT superfamily N-acetyltransferase
VTVTLRDGADVEVRAVEPDDRAALAEGFERLSPESRYRRFFGPMPRLSARDLDYLTRVDHHDHEALVAVDAVTGDGVGVARYVRTGPDVAEPAIVVADDWQGRGVGGLLLDALAERATEEGVRRFEAPVLATNHEAIALLERLGRTTRRPDGREVQLSIDLPAGAPAGRWRSLLAQFAAGTVQPARTLLDALWPRRRGEPGAPRRKLIVVGTDGSAHATAALEAAAELAARSDAVIEVVAAHRFLPTDQAELAAALHTAAHALRERGLHVHERLGRGDPALVLTDVAADEDARLIVVGAGERGKTARRLIGSVADSVAERASCDVLIVRPRDEGDPGGEP